MSAEVDFDYKSGGARLRCAKWLHFPVVAVGHPAVFIDCEVARIVSNRNDLPLIILEAEVFHGTRAALLAYSKAYSKAF